MRDTIGQVTAPINVGLRRKERRFGINLETDGSLGTHATITVRESKDFVLAVIAHK